jgi:TetR/AcrR family transcriptional repressor of nem operon
MSPGPQKQFDRDDVLERAMRLFWRQGYEATSLNELLEEMGIGRQSLYDTFGDKRELYLEALNHYYCSRVGPIQAQLRAPGSVLENMRLVVGMWEKMALESGGCGCLVGNSTAEKGATDPDIAARLAGYYKTLEEAFKDAFERGQKQGEITREVEAGELAGVFLRTTQGIALLSRVIPDRESAAEVIRTALEIISAK